MASSKDDFISKYDILKSKISGETIQIEPKNVDSYSIDNILEFIFISNHKDSLYLETGDRRYFCLEVSDKYAQNTKYFTNIRDNYFNKEVYNNFSLIF